MKNLEEMRNEAVKQLEQLRLGKVDYEDVHTFCSVCRLILDTLKIEIVYMQKSGNNKPIDYIEAVPEKKLLNKF